MIRRLTAVGAVLAANAPWVLVWARSTHGAHEKFDPITALLILLLLGITVSVAVPCLLLKDLLPRRWILITLLVFVNVFWPLRWVQLRLARGELPGTDPTQRMFLSEMIVSSAVATALYMAAGAALGFLRRRRAEGH
ncbi:MAG: hypothetical protein HQ559_00300 [Lentisphaerae bacterium]|nr:hypothetical protein [Lentisphaerota bacterium]